MTSAVPDPPSPVVEGPKKRRGRPPKPKLPKPPRVPRPKHSQLGKPWTMTDAVRTAFLESIEAGASVTGACRAACLARETFYHWKKKAAKGLEPYKSFFVDLDKAWGNFEDRNVKIIANAADDDWKAAAWALERNPKTAKTYRAQRPTAIDLSREAREERRDKREAEKHAREMGLADVKEVRLVIEEVQDSASSGA